MAYEPLGFGFGIDLDQSYLVLAGPLVSSKRALPSFLSRDAFKSP